MINTNYCTQCGHRLESGADFCPQCGTKIMPSQSRVINQSTQFQPNESTKSSKMAFGLCIFFGMLGFHRFYVGKLFTGLLMLLTAGGLGVWVLIDLILIISNKFEDRKGRPLELTHNLTASQTKALVIGSIMGWFIVVLFSIISAVFYVKSGVINTVYHQFSAVEEPHYETKGMYLF